MQCEGRSYYGAGRKSYQLPTISTERDRNRVLAVVGPPHGRGLINLHQAL